MDPAGQSPHGGSRTASGSIGEPRWPMAIAVLATGALHAVLYPELRSLPAALLGDSAWASQLVSGSAIWLTNVIAFALW